MPPGSQNETQHFSRIALGTDKSPSGTVCEQDATTVASKSNSYGKVQLRWSSTCKTNWTRVVPTSSSYSSSGKIRRTSDGRSYMASGTGTRFTKMLSGPRVWLHQGLQLERGLQITPLAHS